MMEEHWTAGYNDAVRTLRHPEVLQRPNGRDGFFTFDLPRIEISHSIASRRPDR
jgi:NTE family protein